MIGPTAVADEASGEAVEVRTSTDSINPSWVGVGNSSSGSAQIPEVVPYF